MFGKILCSLEQPHCFSLRLDDYIYTVYGILSDYKAGFVLFNTSVTAPSSDENLVWM